MGAGGVPSSYVSEAAGTSLALRLGLANPGVRIGLAAGSFVGVVLLLQGLSGGGAADEVRCGCAQERRLWRFGLFGA